MFHQNQIENKKDTHRKTLKSNNGEINEKRQKIRLIRLRKRSRKSHI